ncbi:MAG: FecR domain-containing protein, partial [Gammaproteobacteria bacterium]|nr:FecR domain-containing protein [Gammaproteobacteria bacterium]
MFAIRLDSLAKHGAFVLVGGLFALACAPVASRETVPQTPPGTYVVQPGDTLWDLSNKYLATPSRWPEIQRDNDVPLPELLQPGQILRLGEGARVIDVSGQVLISRDGATQVPLLRDAVVQPGDVLMTGREGFLALGLADGSRVVIPSSSAAKLVKLRGQSIRIELLDGRIESYVEKRRKRDFEIRTRTFSLGVKGTHFRARSDSDAQTVEVLEGSVVAKPLEAEGPGVPVLAGQGARLEDGESPRTRKLLPAPAQQISSLPGWVTANAVEGAAAYQLQLARDPAFISLASESQTERPEFRLAGLTTGFYHTRISAFDRQHVEGQVDMGVIYQGEARTAERDATRREAGQYEIRWTLDPSRRHTFELSRSEDFSSVVAIESGSFPSGVTVGPLNVPGRYYWRSRDEVEG